jgi:hypothetical protein
MKAVLICCLVMLGAVIIVRGVLDFVTVCDSAVGCVFGAILNELLRGEDNA